MSKQNFARKSFYIRNNDLWILEAIKAVLKQADGVGIRCTDSDVIVNALSEYLQEYKRVQTKTTPITKSVVELKRTVTCPTQKAHLFERIEEIVKIKKATGVHTSFSYELIMLALAGLTSNQDYGTMMRTMLKNFKGKL